MLAAALEHVVKGIVDHPDDVRIDSSTSSRGDVLEVHVHPEDRGRVIGRGGRTAKALRSLAQQARASVADSEPSADLLAKTFSHEGRVGLGDWKFYERRGVDNSSIGRWRQALPRSIAAHVIPKLAPFLSAYGYPIPNAPRVPDRQGAIRQFELAKRMHMSARQQPKEPS